MLWQMQHATQWSKTVKKEYAAIFRSAMGAHGGLTPPRAHWIGPEQGRTAAKGGFIRGVSSHGDEEMSCGVFWYYAEKDMRL